MANYELTENLKRLAVIIPIMKDNLVWCLHQKQMTEDEIFQRYINFYMGSARDYEVEIEKMNRTGQRPNDSTGTLESNMASYTSKMNKCLDTVLAIEELVADIKCNQRTGEESPEVDAQAEMKVVAEDVKPEFKIHRFKTKREAHNEFCNVYERYRSVERVAEDLIDQDKMKFGVILAHGISDCYGYKEFCKLSYYKSSKSNHAKLWDFNYYLNHMEEEMQKLWECIMTNIERWEDVR